MMFFDAISRLIPRLGVVAFGGLIAFLIAVHVLSAIDWLWFLPDAFWPSTSEPTLPVPDPEPTESCITMPDGARVCDEPVPATSDWSK